MKKPLLAIGLGSSFALAAPVYADCPPSSGGMTQSTSSNMNQQSTSGGMSKQQANNPAMQGKRAVIGEVVDMREIQLKGTSTKHHLVKISNEQGKNLVVDLGDASRAPGNDFRRGTNIVAIGKEARINGKPVLHARYVGDLQEAGGVGARAR